MKPDALDQHLAAYAKQPLPSAPTGTKADIWREIECRRRQSFWARSFPVLDWHEIFSEPRLAGAALAFAVAMGVFPAVLVARAENQKRLARESIHLEVFTASPPGQLAMLMLPPPSASRLRR
jgi:hypothetical protein